MSENIDEKIIASPVQGKPLEPLRVGIICSPTNREDLIEYKEELISINRKLGGKVELVIYGYNGKDEEDDWLGGLNFEFVRPTSIIHYFKQLRGLDLDVVFIPLKKSVHNVTSEDYSKYLEAGLFEIPIISVNIFPYQKIIQDKVNGFLYKEKHELIPLLDHLYVQRELVRSVGRNAYRDVTTEFNFSPERIKLVSNLFIKD